MIVNPGTPGAAQTVALRRSQPAERISAASGDIQSEALGCGSCGRAAPRARSRFFLGADGALYEVID
jgi:hypothetical protein